MRRMISYLIFAALSCSCATQRPMSNATGAAPTAEIPSLPERGGSGVGVVSPAVDFQNTIVQSGYSGQASFYVQAIGEDAPLLAYNATRAQNPASVIKLVTSYAAIKTLGADYRWRTELLSEEKPDADGSLKSPLYLKGSGDPQLVIEKIDALVKSLAANGVTHLQAPIVMDRSIFGNVREDAGSFDGEPSMPYNAQPDAALMNFHALSFNFDPATRQVSVTPYLMDYAIDNSIQWVNGACPSGGWKSAIALNVSGTMTRVGGRYYSGCGAQSWHVHAYQLSANAYALGVLAGLMPASTDLSCCDGRSQNPRCSVKYMACSGHHSVGMAWDKASVLDGTTPKHASVLASIDSAPLTDELRDMNLYSNNVMARQVYLSLSAKEKGQGNLAASAEIVRKRLGEQGLHLKSLSMGNGSGLSRSTAISAADLGAMLVRASSDADFVNTIARLGIEGTVKNRLTDTDMVGRGRIKTGSLNDVRAIAGYIDGKSGRRYAIVSIIQSDNAQTASGKKLHDDFMVWVGNQ